MPVMTDITCVLPRPSIAELHDDISTELSRRLLGGAPVLPMTTEDVLAFVMAGTVNLMHGWVTQALKENDAATMCCDNLIRYAARIGINLRGATRAKGYVSISGTPAAPIPPNIRFVGASSREYKLDPGVTFNPTLLDSTGRAVLRIVAALPGGEFNLGVGSPLTVATTLPGIDPEGLVIGNGMIGGTSNETCDMLRARVLAAESSMILSTNEKWYITETLRYPGVTRACTDECEGCCDPTYLVIYPFFEGVYGDAVTAPYGVPPGEVIDEMNWWMWGRNVGKGEGLAPVGVQGTYRCGAPVKINVTGYCFRGCDDIAIDRIIKALNTYIRIMYCVGSPICREHLRAAVYGAVGDPCFSTVTFTFDPPEAVRRQDDAYIVLECGVFPVLGEVVVTDAPAPEINPLPQLAPPLAPQLTQDELETIRKAAELMQRLGTINALALRNEPPERC